MKMTSFAEPDDLALETEWADLEFDTDNGPQSVLFTRGGRNKLRENRAFSNETGRPMQPNLRERSMVSDATAVTEAVGGLSQRSMSNLDSVRSSAKKKSTSGLSLLGLGPRGKSSVFMEPIDTPNGSRSPRHSMFARSRTSNGKSGLARPLPYSAPNTARAAKQTLAEKPSISPVGSAVSSGGAPPSDFYDSSNSFLESGFTRLGSNNSSGQSGEKTSGTISRSCSKSTTMVLLTRTGGTKWYRDMVAVHTNALRMEVADLESIVNLMLGSPALLSDRDVKLLYQWLKITRTLTEQVLHILVSAICKTWLRNTAADVERSLSGVREEIMSAFDALESFKSAFLDANRENVLDELHVLAFEAIMCVRSLINVAEVDVADAIRFNMSAEDVEEGDEIVRSFIAQGHYVKSGIYISFLVRWMRNGEDSFWFERVAGRGRMEKAKFSISKANFEKYHTFVPKRFLNKYSISGGM